MRTGLLLSAAALCAATSFGSGAKSVCEPFPLGDVRLEEGPFMDAFRVNRTYLLDMVEPDRLLAGFRAVAGLPKKADRYRGWEGAGVHGQGLGHYLGAVSALYAVTGDLKAKERVDYIVNELAECQKANGNGYVMTIPQDAVWNRLKAGEVRAGGFDILGWWVPNYSLHKVFAGLRDAYRLAGNKTALKVERRLGDWYLDVVKDIEGEKLQILLGAEWGGLNETFVQLYEDTRDRRFLDAAWNKFCDKRVFDPLLHGEDRLNGFHANTQVPKIVGLAALYQNTGKDEYRLAAETFWTAAAKTRAFACGGHSDCEHFYDVRETPRKLGKANAETCNVHNLLRLTGRIFTWSPTADRMDWAERALINQIRAQIGRRPGEFGYFISQCPVAEKVFSTPFDSWWCCVCSGLENPLHYAAHSYYRSDDALWINMYHATALDWKEKGLRLVSTTRFPEEDTIRYAVSTKSPVELTFRLRHPSWCEGMSVKVNGKSVKVTSYPSSYFDLRRVWREGDAIEVKLPMKWRAESLPFSDNSFAAFMYGPTLMVGITPPEEGKEDFAKRRWEDQNAAPARTDQTARIVLAEDKAHPERPKDIEMMPFWKVYEEHYTIYFPVVTPAEYEAEKKRIAREAEEAARRRANTVDEVSPGFQQSEVDHGFAASPDTAVGEHLGRKWRDAKGEKGFISYIMKVDPVKDNELVCTWWGEDGGRTFDLCVDDTPIAEIRLDAKMGHRFFNTTHLVPRRLTDGKSKVKVSFRGKPGTWVVGGLFGVSTVRK